MEGENIYDKIQEIFGEVPGTFSVLEEKIDIDLQMEYFEFSRSIKKDLDEEKMQFYKTAKVLLGHTLYSDSWLEL